MNFPAIRRKIVFLGAMLVIILAAFIVRDYLQLKEVRHGWEAKAKELSALKAKVARINAEVASYEEEKENFKKYLFNEQDVPAFLDSISGFAQKSEVGILDMKTQRFREVRTPMVIQESSSRLAVMKKEKKEKAALDSEERLKKILTLASMPISIKVEGTFSALLEFFANFDDFQQLLTITDFEISSGRGYPILKCNFILTIYSLKTIEELENK